MSRRVDKRQNGGMIVMIKREEEKHLIGQARQGDMRGHGFKHHSKDRRANLKICYEVIMYKLAEQIILDNRCIKAPSYYHIFPGKTLDFVEVKVDSC